MKHLRASLLLTLSIFTANLSAHPEPVVQKLMGYGITISTNSEEHANGLAYLYDLIRLLNTSHLVMSGETILEKGVGFFAGGYAIPTLSGAITVPVLGSSLKKLCDKLEQSKFGENHPRIVSAVKNASLATIMFAPPVISTILSEELEKELASEAYKELKNSVISSLQAKSE